MVFESAGLAEFLALVLVTEYAAVLMAIVWRPVSKWTARRLWPFAMYLKKVLHLEGSNGKATCSLVTMDPFWSCLPPDLSNLITAFACTGPVSKAAYRCQRCYAFELVPDWYVVPRCNKQWLVLSLLNILKHLEAQASPPPSVSVLLMEKGGPFWTMNVIFPEPAKYVVFAPTSGRHCVQLPVGRAELADVIATTLSCMGVSFVNRLLCACTAGPSGTPIILKPPFHRPARAVNIGSKTLGYLLAMQGWGAAQLF